MAEGLQLSIEAVLAKFGEEAWTEELVRSVMSGELESIAEQVLEDGLLYLKKKKLMLQRKRVGERLRQVAGDSEETQRLMQEILFLDREITRLKGNV
jgi:hypothetical protein